MRLTMTKQFRWRVTAVTTGCQVTSFLTHLWLFFSYFASHPREPHPELGLVHSLNNHGSYAFISDAESTGLALLLSVFFIGFVLTLIFIPKEFRPPKFKISFGPESQPKNS